MSISYNIEFLNDMEITSIKELHKLRLTPEGYSIITKTNMRINYIEFSQ